MNDLVLTKNFAAIDRGIIRSKKMRMITVEAELHYYKLLLTVDSYGDYPADVEELAVEMYGMRSTGTKCRKDRKVTSDDVEMWQIELHQQGLIKYYNAQTNNGDVMELFHITNYLGCGNKGFVRQPKYPVYPELNVMLHPSVRKQLGQTRGDTNERDETCSEPFKEEKRSRRDVDPKKKKEELEIVGTLRWPEHYGQKADPEYPVYRSTMDEALSLFPEVPDPADAIADFLRYHKAHDAGPHYPTGPDTVGASFVYWLQHRKPAAKVKPAAEPDEYMAPVWDMAVIEPELRMADATGWQDWIDLAMEHCPADVEAMIERCPRPEVPA